MNAPLNSKTLADPILQELWHIKDQLAKQHHYSPREIVEQSHAQIAHRKTQSTPLSAAQ